MKSWVKKGIATLALATASAAGFAFTLSTGTPSSSFNWSFNTGTPSGTLTGTGTMTYISGFNTNNLVLEISLSNTTVNNDGLTGAQGDRITAFGFGIDPAATSVTFTDLQDTSTTNDGGMIGASFGANFPAYKIIDICAYGGQNCAGGSGGGIFEGATDVFRLTLGRTTAWGTSVVIDPVAFKSQGPNGSFEFNTTSTGIVTTSSGKISEPATGSMAFLGLGLLAAGFVARRRKESQAV